MKKIFKSKKKNKYIKKILLLLLISFFSAYMLSKIGVFKSENIAPKKYKEREHERFVENNRTVAGVCSLISLPLMLGALAFMILTFITFNPGTADQYYGTVYTPYSLIFLVPSFILAVVAFFKSKDINFKSVNRLAAAEVIINGIVTLLGFVILILFTSGSLF